MRVTSIMKEKEVLKQKLKETWECLNFCSKYLADDDFLTQNARARWCALIEVWEIIYGKEDKTWRDDNVKENNQ